MTAAGSRAAGSGTGLAHAGADRRVLGGLGAPGHLPGPAGLRAWGWVTLIIAALQLVAAGDILMGNQLARWFAVAVVGLNAIEMMFFIPAYPVLGTDHHRRGRGRAVGAVRVRQPREPGRRSSTAVPVPVATGTGTARRRNREARNPKSSLIVVRACDGGDAHATGPNLSTEGYLPGPAVAAVGRSRGRSLVRKVRRRAGQSDVTTLTGTGVRGADGPVIGPKVPYRRCLRA